MKPNFALGLTQDGITLWQRGASGWLRVGAVSPDAPEMDAQMRDLAKIASALAPDGVHTKLVVPDEQILFCDVPVSARNPEMQAHEIRAQLAGRTPYPVEELDFDWTVKDGTAQVAVVARETVIEAEDFATLYGLNPVSVVAAPQAGRFAQEPFFGTTRGARDLIGDPARLERDRDILKETGSVTLPDPELVAAEKPPVASENGAKPAAQTPPAPAPTVPDTAKATEPETKKAPVADTKPAKDSLTPTATPAQSPAAPSKPASASPAEDRKATLLSKLKSAKADSDSAGALSTPSGLTALLNARQAKDKTPEATAPTATLTPTQQKENTSDEAMAFRSRRATAASAKPAATPNVKAQDHKPGKDLLGALRRRLGSRPGLSKLSFGALDKLATAPKPAKSKAQTPEGVKPAGAAALTPAQQSTPAPQTRSSNAPAPAKAQGTGRNAAPAPAGPAKATNTGLPQRKDPLDTLHARANSGSGQSEVDRMTIFGARNNDTPEASPARRALLVLGGVGLLLLAAAIWAFYFAASPTGIAPQLSEDINPVVEPAPLAADISDPTDGALMQDEIEAALGLEDAAQQLPIDATGPEFAQDTPITPSPPSTVANDVTAGRIAGLRSASLLPPQEAVPLPDAPSAPAPFGADPLPPLREDIAAETAVPEATTGSGEDSLLSENAAPAGSSLPEGEEALDITVSQGTPPVTPPARPEALAPEPEIAPTPEPEAAPEQALADQTAADPLDESLLVIDVTEGRPPVTPPVRPAGLTPEPPPPTGQPADADPDSLIQPIQQGTEDSSSADQAGLNAPPPGGVALSALRPATRPAELEETAATAAAEPEFDASQLAVAASLRPGARPGQFAAVVQRALRAAQPRTSTQAPAATIASAPAPEAAIQTARAAVPAAPPIPASASVAREATQARAINLRQINLIGVMGTSSARRALVRLSNGRVVAVRVGEQLDGGQVTAIGENELRYVRRGRDVVLRIAS